jgi:hypothetical protein
MPTATATADPKPGAEDAPAQDFTAVDLRARADEVFEKVSPYSGFGFRNHCRRLHRFATALLQRHGLHFDEDVAYMIAMWHDLGIVTEQDEGHNYLQRSRALFRRESEGLDLGDVDGEIVDECLLYNHRVLPVPGLSPHANCFRQAVMIEHARGRVRFGLDETFVERTFEDLPRGNFDRVLLDFTYRTIRREPLTLVRGIFF